MEKNVSERHNKKTYLEMLRIIAILMVIYNHTPGFATPPPYGGTALVFLHNLTMELCKMAVPVFFMISGALLLNRDAPLRVIFRKRILRFLIVIVGYGLLQYAYAIYENSGEMQWSWRLVMQTIYSGWPINLQSASYPSAVWFLYAYLAMMLFLPILRMLAKAMETKHYIYLFSLQILLMGALPLTTSILYSEGACGFSRTCSYFPFVLGGIYATYMLLGHFCENVLDKTPHRNILVKNLLWATPLSLFLGAAGMYLFPNIRTIGIPNEMQQSGFTASFLILPCAFFYLLTKKLIGYFPQESVIGRILCYLGGGVFTVMLTENLFRANLMSLYETLVPHLGVHFASCVLALATFCPAVLLGCLLKKLPVVRKYV